jgi:L-ascorbate metabolism protein UlaG (beta-lactamase superfamily)
VVAERARITYVGHATVLLELGATRILTDPLLRDRFLHVPRHSAPPDPAVAEDLDGVLISHLHMDHLDPPSLREIGREVALVVPKGAAGMLRRRGFENVTELVPGASTTLGAVRIRATRATHNGRRYKLGRRVPALGYLIESASLRVYFAGDTDLFDEMDELAGVDVALLPVAGWGPKQMGRGHLDPVSATDAAIVIRPRIVVPIHWGTFLNRRTARRHPEALTQAPRELARQLRRRAPDVEPRMLEPGQAFEL